MPCARQTISHCRRRRFENNFTSMWIVICSLATSFFPFFLFSTETYMSVLLRISERCAQTYKKITYVKISNRGNILETHRWGVKLYLNRLDWTLCRNVTRIISGKIELNGTRRLATFARSELRAISRACLWHEASRSDALRVPRSLDSIVPNK